MVRKFILLTGWLAVCFLAGCAVNPITGREELMLFPESYDVSIGQHYAPEIEKQMGGRIKDERLQSYVDYVGQKAAQAGHKPELDYHFTALEDKSVNAFALPGGYLFITRGMLEKLSTEAQLAGIWSHEIVHVVARDTMNAMSNQIGMDILLSTAMSDQTSSTVRTTVDLARQIMSLRYSRSDERTADLGGMDYMVAAGYNPYGMVETMQILQEQQKYRSIEFLSSHPDPANRVEYLTENIEWKYPDISDLTVGQEDYRRGVLERLGK
jgi:predicted Zn-dependent protease